MMWMLGSLVSALALADAWLLIASPISLWTIVAWCALTAALGWWGQRGEDLTLWSEIESDVQNGRVPTDEAVDAMLAVLGGWALIVPGWLTDVAGGFMMIPQVRQASTRLIRRAVRTQLDGRRGNGRSNPH